MTTCLVACWFSYGMHYCSDTASLGFGQSLVGFRRYLGHQMSTHKSHNSLKMRAGVCVPYVFDRVEIRIIWWSIHQREFTLILLKPLQRDSGQLSCWKMAPSSAKSSRMYAERRVPKNHHSTLQSELLQSNLTFFNQALIRRARSSSCHLLLVFRFFITVAHDGRTRTADQLRRFPVSRSRGLTGTHRRQNDF